MIQHNPVTITISRELGAGGALLGKKLSKRLNFNYLDKDIIKKTAQKLDTYEESIELCDEKIASIWQTIARTYSYNEYGLYTPYEAYFPSDKAIFKVQSDIIKSLSKSKNSVVIGRAGFHILKDFQNHISIFLHCSTEKRLERIKKHFNLEEVTALKFLKSTDKNRSKYIKIHTKKDMFNLKNYHFTFDSGVINIDKISNIIYNYIINKYKL